MRKKQFAFRITAEEDELESTAQLSAENDIDSTEFRSNLKENSPLLTEYQFDAEGRATLPDGTPVVEPVPVDGKVESSHKRPKLENSLRTSRLANAGVLDVVKCTACSTTLQIALSPLKIHPVLRVITCKRCAKFYARQKFQQDGSGNDENCRWCGDGGDLICCDTCSNAFCKRCIKRNLGRSALSELEALGDNDVWKCVVCDPSPIRRLQNQCSEVMKEVKELRAFRRLRHEKRQEERKPQSLPSGQKSDRTEKVGSASSKTSTIDGYSVSQPATQSTPLDTLSNLFAQLSQSALQQSASEPIPPSTLTNFLQGLGQTIASPSNPPAPQPLWSGVGSNLGSLPPKIRHCNLGYLPVAPTPIHSIEETTLMQQKPATTTTSASGFDVYAILNQIKNVNTDNIRVALKATRRCIETFAADIRHLEYRMNKVSNPSEIAPIVRSFQSAYRFHFFARLANLATRMREELPRSLNRSTFTMQQGPRTGPDYLPVGPPSYIPVTIDLTHDNLSSPIRIPSSVNSGIRASVSDKAMPACTQSTDPTTSDASSATQAVPPEIVDSASNDSDTSSTSSVSMTNYEPASKKIRTDTCESSLVPTRSTSNREIGDGNGTDTAHSSIKTEAKVKRSGTGLSSSVDVNKTQLIKTSILPMVKSPIKSETTGDTSPRGSVTMTDWNSASNFEETALDDSEHPSNSISTTEVCNVEPTKNVESDTGQPPIQESSVCLEDIRLCIGDTSVIDLRDASKHKLPPELVNSVSSEHGSSSEPDSDTEFADLNASVSALEKACANLDKRPGSKSGAKTETADRESTNGETQQPQKQAKSKRKHVLGNADDNWSIEEEPEDDVSSEETPLIKEPLSTDAKGVSREELRSALLEQSESEYRSDLNYRARLLHSSSDEEDQRAVNENSAPEGSSNTEEVLEEEIGEADANELNNVPKSSRPTTGAKYTGALRQLMQPLSNLEKGSKVSSSKSSEQSTQSDKEESPAGSETQGDLSASVKSNHRTKTTEKKPDRWFSSDDSDSESSSSSGKEFFETGKRQFRRTKGKPKKKSALDSGNSESSSSENIKLNKARNKLSTQLNEHASSEEDKPRRYANQNQSNMKPTRRRRSRLKKQSDEESAEEKASDASVVEGKGSSEHGSDGSDAERKGRRKIRKIYTMSHLSQTTKTAEAEERERRRRISDRQKLYNDWVIQEGEGLDVVTKKLILEKPTDKSSSTSVVRVHSDILKHLKPHQVEAVRFLWDCVIESVERQQKSPNDHSGGAILAHCMGLGKSLSVIAFVHTVFAYADLLKFKTCLIICPVNTLLNWKHEWEHWLPEEESIDVFELASKPDRKLRLDVLKHWFRKGGVLLIGYDMFRNFVIGKKATRSKVARETVTQALLDPGPDIVICDEGHLLKNDKSGLSKAVSQIRTLKRVVLTGTPLQNNLNEYHAMVNFVKPNLLGTVREFNNRFGNPIRNGQHSNSTERDVKLMKRRAHVLYKMLDGCVQRKDYNALTKYLPPRYEYVVMCRLSDVQRELYQTYLRVRADRLPLNTNYRGEETRQTLFRDQQTLYRVWTHPFLLRSHETREARRMLLENDDEESTGSTDASDTTEETTDSGSSSSETDCRSGKLKAGASTATTHKRRTRSNKTDPEADVVCLDSSEDTQQALGEETNSKDPWWYKAYKDEYDWCLEVGGKLEVLFHLLKKCTDIGDKVIIFTQSLLSLDLLERFLGEVHRQWLVRQGELIDVLPEGETSPRPDLSRYFSDVNVNTWVRGHDYERMDGSMNAMVRKNLQHRFNRVSNTRLRLFLISTRAGGLGINLTAANRLILFDACWNPSHDIQSIFRSYRFGQTKPVYIYRLIAQGTMEEKIYDRQVTKQSLSLRVVDEQQIDRHFTMADLLALYSFDPDIWIPSEADKRPTPKLPKDRLLADMLSEFPNLIVNYHEHDSLLEHREDEGLTETERQEAWREYEEEKTLGMSLAQHQRMLQQQEIMAQTQQHLQNFRVGFQLPQMEPRTFLPPANRYYPYVGAGSAVRNINPTPYPPTIPRHPVEPPPVAPPAMAKIPNSGMPYMELFDKYRSYVLKNRPSLAADPVQLENTVLSYIMDSLSKQVRGGQPSNSVNFMPGQPGRPL